MSSILKEIGVKRKSKIILISFMLVASFLIIYIPIYVIDYFVTIKIENRSILSEYENKDSTGAAVARWDISPLCIASDEFAASQQPRGEQFWKYINETAPGVFKYARIHNIFTSSQGDRRGKSNAGGDVVQKYDNGTIWYDWSIVDDVYDLIVHSNVTPLVELGFMPKILSSNPDEEPERRMPDKMSDWENLITAFLNHMDARYGLERMKNWRYEVWNEPDAGSFWVDSWEDYFELYKATVETIKDFNADLKVGGPAVAKDMNFFRKFLEYCSKNEVPLDFISFHTKGGEGVELNPSHLALVTRIRSYFDILREFRDYDQRYNENIEYICTEADPIVGSHRSKEQNPVFGFRDTEYYAAWFVHTLINLMHLQIEYGYSLHATFSNNILFPWEVKTFHGTRGFLTPLFKKKGDIETRIPEDMPLPECSAVLGKPIFTASQLIDKIPKGRAEILRSEILGIAALTNRINVLSLRSQDSEKEYYQILVSNHEELQIGGKPRYIHFEFDFKEEEVDQVEIKEWRIDENSNNAFRL